MQRIRVRCALSVKPLVHARKINWIKAGDDCRRPLLSQTKGHLSHPRMYVLCARYRDPTPPTPFSPRRYYSAANLPRSRANETFTITGLLYLFSPSSAANDVTRRVCRHVLVTDADTVDLIKRNWMDVEENEEDDDRERTTARVTTK